MAPPNTVNTISDLKNETLAPGAAVFVLGYYTPGDGGGGIFRADPSSNEPEDGSMVVAPTPSTGRWIRVYDGSISVKYFGARALGDATSPAVASKNRAAIQAAINFALNPTQGHSAAVITFPANTSIQSGGIAEYKVDGPLILPRLPYFAYSVLRGDGQRVCQITRVKPAGWHSTMTYAKDDRVEWNGAFYRCIATSTNQLPSNLTDWALDSEHLFICDEDPTNPHGGSYLLEHLALAALPNTRAFDWTPPIEGDIARPEIHFNEMCFHGGASSTVGLVHLKQGHRCRFYNCEFTGLDTSSGVNAVGTTGVAIWLEKGAGTTIINSRSIGTSGALIKCSDDGELVMINCRCEGAKDLPAFDFQNCEIITLIAPTTEGRREGPALFRFINCSQVVVTNPTLAQPEYPYCDNKFADGMLFQHCQDFTVIQPMANASFTQADDKGGDFTARAIRIDKDCCYGVIRGLHCNHHASDTDVMIEEGAKYCYVEVLSAGRDQSPGRPGGLVGMGTLVADSLRGSNGFWAHGNQQQYDQGLPVPHPTGYDFELGGGDGYTPGKHLAGNTIIQLGRPDVDGNTAQLLLQKGPDCAFGRLWYQEDSYLKLESLCTALRLRSAGDLVLEQAASMIALEAQGNVNFTAGMNGALPTFIWRGQGGNTTRTDTMPHDQPNQHNYVATVPVVEWQHNGKNRIAFDATGLGFYDKTPIAKPTVTGSHGGNAALASLLSALDALGLIDNQTTP